MLRRSGMVSTVAQGGRLMAAHPARFHRPAGTARTAASGAAASGRRLKSSQAALHPSAAAAQASPLSSSTSTTRRGDQRIQTTRTRNPTAGSSVPPRPAPPTSSQPTQLYGTHAATRTLLPTPLPPELSEQRSAALRRRLNERAARGNGGRQPMKPKSGTEGSAATAGDGASAFPQLSFGDFGAATLRSLDADEAFFTPSHTIENIAILRACLNTGLVNRASKIFDRMREEIAARSQEHDALSLSASHKASSSADRLPAFSSPLDTHIYNAMISAYFRKASQEDGRTESTVWLRKAWGLFDELEAVTDTRGGNMYGLSSNPATYAIMAKGIVRLHRAQRYPSNLRNLPHLLANLRRSQVKVEDVFLSSASSQEASEMERITSSHRGTESEPDMRNILMFLSSAAADMADNAMSSELAKVDRLLTNLEAEAQQSVDPTSSSAMATTDAPQLRPVQSTRKGDVQGADGVQDMSFNLKVLQENLSIVGEARRSSSDPYERQRSLEFGALAAARERFKHSAEQLEEIGLKNAGKMKGKQLQQWMWDWYCKLEKALADDIQRIGKHGDANAPKASGTNSMELDMHPFLSLLPPGKLALITILELMRLQGTGGVADGMKTASALVSVGRNIESECYAEQLRKSEHAFSDSKNITQSLKKRGLSDMQVRRELKIKLQKQAEMNGEEKITWTNSLRARIGSFVTQHLMNVATVRRAAVDRDGVRWDDEQPAFYSAYQYIQGKRLGVIKLNDVVAEHLGQESALETLHPRHLPMLVPPKPWLSYDSGGYYSAKSRALRYKDDVEQGSYLKAASENGSLEQVLAGLDVLGSTAWAVNDSVFSIMAEVWNSGKTTADMPALELSEEEPQRPDNYDSDIKARGIYLKRLKHYNLRRASMHSQRCDINYKLEIARAFLGERFYFPHNMDFRGRAYPIPPHLNHIGNDLCRGLLRFADAKTLGAVGLRWLRIHLANKFGYDKASFSEREQFAIDHEEDLRKSANDPLGEGTWWQKADDPWQTLAACIELNNALNYPEGPEKFASSLPVHQDGTCNGLQHYAALGGDLVGAKQVNLSGGDRPSDVYTGVADLVISVLEREAAAGDPTAKKLQGKITRKVVKQTVMTTVYGVTFIGAKEQVSRQLADVADISAEDLWHCASYLAARIIECIGDLFKGAQALQVWLSESALLIAKSIPPERLEQALNGPEQSGGRHKVNMSKLAKEQMTSVIWTTPLGLPVVQPYRKLIRKQLRTAMQTVFLHDPHVATQVSPAKQASAFPPNFIHSLDATHMFLTALACQNAKLTFASVHDSYWTHASDIETMSDIIRDTFVHLHSSDILKALKDEFLTRYQGHRVPIKAIHNTLRKRESRNKKSASSKVVVEVGEDGKLVSRVVDGGAGAGAGAGSEAVAAKAQQGHDAEAVSGADDPAALSTDSDIADVDAAADDSVVDEVDGADAAEEDEPPLRRSTKGKKGDAAASNTVDAQFVPLADVLPEIPQKGTFDVNEIKRSLYFFS